MRQRERAALHSVLEKHTVLPTGNTDSLAKASPCKPKETALVPDLRVSQVTSMASWGSAILRWWFLGVVLNFKLNFSIAFFFPPSRFVESLVLVSTFLWQIVSASVPALLLSNTHSTPRPGRAGDGHKGES